MNQPQIVSKFAILYVLDTGAFLACLGFDMKDAFSHPNAQLRNFKKILCT